MSVKTVEKLGVYWKNSLDQRFYIGTLCQTAAGFLFDYDANTPSEFRGFPEFPIGQGPFERRYLSSSFSTRVMSPQRPEFADFIERLGVSNPDNQLEILAKSGGYSLADKIEFYELVEHWDDQFEFRIAGMAYCAQPALSVGVPLNLVVDHTNAYDKHAVEVKLGDTKIGFVPRAYSQIVAEELNSGKHVVSKLVRLLPIRDDKTHWVASVSKTC